MKTFDVSAKEKLKEAVEVLDKIAKYSELIPMYITDPEGTVEKLKDIYTVEGDVYEDILKGLKGIATRPKAVELGKQLIVSQLESLAEHFNHEYKEYLEIPYKMTEDIQVNIDTIKNANIFPSLDEMLERSFTDDVRVERLAMVVKELMLKEFGVEISYEKEPDVYMANLENYFKTIKYENIKTVNDLITVFVNYKLKEDKECYDKLAKLPEDEVSDCNLEYLKELNDNDREYVIEPKTIHIMAYEAATGISTVYNKDSDEKPINQIPFISDYEHTDVTRKEIADKFKIIYELIRDRVEIEDGFNKEFAKAFKPLDKIDTVDQALSYYIELTKRYFAGEISAEWYSEVIGLYTNIAKTSITNTTYVIASDISMLNTLNDEVTVVNQMYDLIVKIITESNI